MAAVFFVLSAPISLFGQHLNLFDLECDIQHWTVDDGLPSTRVGRLAQTPDGYLWIGTASGLSRFNGTEFETIEITDQSVGKTTIDVGDLFVDSTGRLWVIDRRGFILTRDDKGLKCYTKDLGLPSFTTGIIREIDGQITLVINQKRMLSVFRWNGNQAVRTMEPIEVGGAYPYTLMSTDDGTFWGTFFFDGLFSIREGKLQRISTDPKIGIAHSLFPGLDGKTYLLTSLGVCSNREGKWILTQPFKKPLDTTKNINRAAVDQENRLWIGSHQSGLQIVHQDSLPKQVAILPNRSKRDISTVLRANDGSIFAGGRGGLFHFRPNAVRPWPADEKIIQSEVLSIAQDPEGTIWFAGYDGVFSFQNGRVIKASVDPDPNRKLSIIAPRITSGAWVSAVSGVIWQGSGEIWNELPSIQGKGITNAGRIRDVIEVAPGELWICVNRGLIRFLNGRYERIKPAETGSSLLVTVIIKGIDNDVYAGLKDGRLLRWKNGKWQTLIPKREKRQPGISNLSQSPDGTIWYRRSTNALGYWKDQKWGEISKNSLPFSQSFNLATDAQNGLWLGFREMGLVWTDARAIERMIESGSSEEIPYRYLDASNGLISQSISIWNSSLIRAKDGTIWVGGATGASVIDPKRWAKLHQASEAPPVSIESVHSSDKERWKLDESSVGNAAIPAEDDRFEVKFAPIHANPQSKVELRYRLAGHEEDFTTSHGQFLAAYTKVPPGTYQFQVESFISGQSETIRKDEITITVLPHWWELTLVRASGYTIIALIPLLFIAIKFRSFRREQLRKDVAARRILNAEENERKRVAAELHDGVGQSLLVVKNLAALGKRSSSAEESPHGQFQEIANSAADALAEIRSISRALRPPELDRLGLAKALQAMGNRMADSSALDIDLEVDENIKDCLTKEQEISVFRILQEAFNNAVKHAKASELTLHVSRNSNQLTALVSDNGIGFPVSSTRSGLGLETMRERVSLLGGELILDSQPDHGTNIELKVPLKMA